VPNPEIAFYADPKIWSVCIAGVALILSQFPPVHKMFRKGKLELDVYEKAHLTHSLGNPNLQFHLIINNVGGQKVTVEGIESELVFESQQPRKIKAQNFIKSDESNGQVLLTKFKINSGEEWAHLTNFFNDFSKAEEKESKTFIKKTRDEITEKFRTKPQNQDMVEISEPLVASIKSFFDKKFIWEAGEYSIKISIKCSDKSQNVSKNLRFTLFESDSDELREYTEKFKYGESVVYPSKRDVGIITSLKEIYA
jgi:hypothetical protein